MIISDIGFMISEGYVQKIFYEQWFRLSITNPAQKKLSTKLHRVLHCYPAIGDGITFINNGNKKTGDFTVLNKFYLQLSLTLILNYAFTNSR